jgi:hypothetical protein
VVSVVGLAFGDTLHIRAFASAYVASDAADAHANVRLPRPLLARCRCSLSAAAR